MKLDLYKEHKSDYATPKKPVLVDIAPAKYLTIEGKGEPGGDIFSQRIGALYAVAFTLKMENKFAGRDYAVCKMEGLWWTDDVMHGDFTVVPKDQWRWKLMIRTPDFVDAKQVRAVADKLIAKGKAADVRDVKVETIREGKSAQMLHVGPYERERETIEKMCAAAREQGLEFHGLHHEIYLSDPRRVAPEKLKTILRIPVRKATAAATA